MEHPIFFCPSCCSPDVTASEVSPQGEMASTQADVPGGRVPWVLRRDRNPIQAKGGIHMAKKAKGAKKKAAKKR
jgi:hypothetical protein